MKIMTYNVHVWYDNEGKFKLQEIIDLCNEIKPDLLCLQEVTKHGLTEFQKQAGYEKLVKYHGCAILSNLDIEEVLPIKHRNFFPRFTTVRVPLPNNSEFFLSCVHLDHQVEPNRMKEVDGIKSQQSKVLKKDAAQVWAGDFNALNLDDYTETELNEITTIRKNNRWEMPKNDVSTAMKKDGFVCSWTLGGKPAPFATCRFDTHIDYIYINKQFRELFDLKSVIHHPSDASDHKPVVAEYELMAIKTE